MLGIVLGTGPSLNQSAEQVRELGRRGALLFGPNNTFQDFELSVWLACDPQWHKHYGRVTGDFDKFHWDSAICWKYGYQYIEGIWHDHLWTADKKKISLGHCSGVQLLNLAVHYGCDPILLVGHDFRYPEGQPRHYFSGLSETDGEYPQEIRKFSKFKKESGNDLLEVYRKIALTPTLPSIVNCTPGSALPWFPMGDLRDYL